MKLHAERITYRKKNKNLFRIRLNSQGRVITRPNTYTYCGLPAKKELLDENNKICEICAQLYCFEHRDEKQGVSSMYPSNENDLEYGACGTCLHQKYFTPELYLELQLLNIKWKLSFGGTLTVFSDIIPKNAYYLRLVMILHTHQRLTKDFYITMKKRKMHTVVQMMDPHAIVHNWYQHQRKIIHNPNGMLKGFTVIHGCQNYCSSRMYKKRNKKNE